MGRIRRFGNALRDNATRLLVGSAAGQAVVIWYLMMGLVALEQNHVAYDDLGLAQAGTALLMFGAVGGALIAYSMRTEGAKQ